MQPGAAERPPSEVRVVERVRAALVRLHEVHGRTGCLADTDEDAVLVAAAAAEDAPAGPLQGEPVTVKDWIDVAGFRCSGGSLEHRERRPEQDAPAVARLRAAGAVVVAKTALRPVSDCFGAVRHPHDPTRSPGGTSSGDAVAVAGRAVRLGIGSDSGGSVRVPAAWCGVVGLKPSSGLIPTTGHFPRVGDRSDGRTVLGPLAATVDLAWAAVRTMAGPDGADAGVAPVRLGDPHAVEPASLRIAIGVPGGLPVSREVAAALEESERVLAGAGARLGGAVPDWVDEALRVTQAHWQRDSLGGEQVAAGLVDWDRFRRRTLLATREVDVLVTPTVAHMAPEHRPMEVDDYLFCLPASLTGAPAVSVPVGDGAVQVIAHRWADHVAVAVSRLLERADRGARSCAGADGHDILGA